MQGCVVLLSEAWGCVDQGRGVRFLRAMCRAVNCQSQEGTPRSPRAHQPASAQRENVPSRPTFPHMEMRAPGAAQGGFPVAVLPGVATSRLPGVTLGALLVKDQRLPC